MRCAARSAPVLIVGCGSPHRRDDQSGLRVVERLESDGGASSFALSQAVAPERPPMVRLMTSESPGADLLAELDGVELLIILDAAPASPAMPLGTWRRLGWRGAQPIVRSAFQGDRSQHRRGAGRPRIVDSHRPRAASPHALGVNEALRLGETLGLLPGEVWIYAIAGIDFGHGEALSDGVESAIAEVAQAVRADVLEWHRRGSVHHA